MVKVNHPDKQVVRDFLRDRQEHPEPPPTPDEVRRQLGWELNKEKDPRDCPR